MMMMIVLPSSLLTAALVVHVGDVIVVMIVDRIIGVQLVIVQMIAVVLLLLLMVLLVMLMLVSMMIVHRMIIVVVVVQVMVIQTMSRQLLLKLLLLLLYTHSRQTITGQFTLVNALLGGHSGRIRQRTAGRIGASTAQHHRFALDFHQFLFDHIIICTRIVVLADAVIVVRRCAAIWRRRCRPQLLCCRC